MEFISNEEQRTHNLASVTTAKLCLQLISIAHGFAGAQGELPKIDVKDFLPFPDWSPEGAQPVGPTPETRSVLARLLETGELPLPIFTQLVAQPSPDP